MQQDLHDLEAEAFRAASARNKGGGPTWAALGALAVYELARIANAAERISQLVQDRLPE